MNRIFVLLLLSLFITESYAGPWTRKKGTGFVQLGYSTIGYNKVYDDRGTKVPIFTDVRDNVLQLFGEYGLFDDLTLTCALPYKMLSASPTSSVLTRVATKQTSSGIGDVDFSARYNWLRSNSLVSSAEVVLGLPVGDSKVRNGLILGDGEFNVAMKLLFGKSFYPTPFYVSADVAYNLRGKSFSNDFFYNLELGYGFLEGKLYLILLLSGRESTSSVPSTLVPASTFGLATNNQEYTAIIPKLLYKAGDRWGVSLTFGTATHGRNIAGGFVFAGGVFYEY